MSRPESRIIMSIQEKNPGTRPVVRLIFRKSNPQFFSIENVFSLLIGIFHRSFNIEEQYVPRFTSSFFNIIRNLNARGKLNADIFHVTGDIHYMALAFPRKKTLLTIHDSVFIRNSRGLKRALFIRLFLKWPVRSCSRVTTISEKSKEEIVQYTGCEPGRITVIPNPVRQNITYQEKKMNPDLPVLLFIGTTSNKNLVRVIQAIRGISCQLDIVGRIPEDQQELLKQNDIRFTAFEGLSEDQMTQRYEACDILVFPSEYEGFGLPIIEAQKAGRPVITSQISPMKEVSGNGAHLVDPFDPDSIREGILKLTRDENYRSMLVEKGFENVRKYAPEIIAAQYMNLYQKMVP
jgi:glycosyltransferase involved in cell wall biosynthesis